MVMPVVRRLIPCRVRDGANPDVMVMTLGDARTALAQGVFDPAQDRVRLVGGRLLPDYYRRRLGIRFFQPLDKRRFPLPPSGWCSWYCHYGKVTAADIRTGAHFIAAHLKAFGMRYCQIDDGWQHPAFDGDTAALAQEILACGLIPGIWLCPQGRSTLADTTDRSLFVRTKEGKPPQMIFGGPHILDPTHPGAAAYLTATLRALARQKFRYFKIDGQCALPAFYRRWRKLLHNPRRDPQEAYRDTLQAIRRGIGGRSFLVGCVGYADSGIGLFDGHRTSHDVDLSYRGFMTAWKATMTGYFLHNVAWYSDPDVVLLRTGSPLETAQAWATMVGITGQATFAGDALPELPPSRLDILKRILPAADIRPLDLYPTLRYKRIWDLKIRHLGRAYDVVAAFNGREHTSASIHISFADLGLGSEASYHVFDFWNREYLGSYRAGLFLRVPAAGCRLLSLVRDNGRPQLLSTSRHITQGWIDLRQLRVTRDRIQGRSAVVADDRYELRFALPRGWRIARARVPNLAAPVAIRNYPGWGAVAWTPTATASVRWTAVLERVPHGPAALTGHYWFLDAHDVAPGTVDIAWTPMNTPGGYRVVLDGHMLGVAQDERIRLADLEPGSRHRLDVQVCGRDGQLLDQPQRLDFTVGTVFPKPLYLSDLEWETLGNSWFFPRRDRSAGGSRLSVGGRVWARGIGANEACDVTVKLFGLFRRFSSDVGIEDHDGYSARSAPEDRGQAVFRIYGDGRLLAESPVMRYGTKAFRMSADIRGVRVLRLFVTNPRGREPGTSHANWCDARAWQ